MMGYESFSDTVPRSVIGNNRISSNQVQRENKRASLHRPQEIRPLSKEEQAKQMGQIPHSRQKTNFRKVAPKFQPIPKSIGAFSGHGFQTSNPWLFN